MAESKMDNSDGKWLVSIPQVCGEPGPPRVPPGSSRVEHEIYKPIDSLLPSRHTLSDHRPVSVSIVER